MAAALCRDRQGGRRTRALVALAQCQGADTQGDAADHSNLWAFLFGPFYYLYLGMWRKAIILSLVALAIDVVLGAAVGRL
jgi:hypothetical protein